MLRPRFQMGKLDDWRCHRYQNPGLLRDACRRLDAGVALVLLILKQKSHRTPRWEHKPHPSESLTADAVRTRSLDPAAEQRVLVIDSSVRRCEQ